MEVGLHESISIPVKKDGGYCLLTTSCFEGNRMPVLPYFTIRESPQAHLHSKNRDIPLLSMEKHQRICSPVLSYHIWLAFIKCFLWAGYCNF